MYLCLLDLTIYLSMLGLILGIPVNVYASLCLFARLLCLLGRVYLCLLDLTIYLSVLGLVCLCVFVLSLLVCLLDLPISSLCYIFRNLLDPLAICCTPARSVFLSFYSGRSVDRGSLEVALTSFSPLEFFFRGVFH